MRIAVRARHAREERACLRVADPLVRIDALYSLRVFGQVGSTGKVLESPNSGPNA